ncbi:MAG: type IV toxin-antitoxin system AbiEi family antitoxin domain-containing protein [Micropruina sp.]|uniref:hypothetical protein n=1 Tax=Micropruina sp. TaxID=2737536 RepID=UPI0039E39AD4
MLPSELLELSLFTTGQASELGVTEVDLRKALADGVVDRLKRGWYSPQQLDRPEDRHRLLVQIETSERPGVIPSHYSAAVVLELPVHRPDWRLVHVMRTTRGPGQHRSGLSIHKQVGTHSSPSAALAIAQTGLMAVESGLMAYDAALRRGLVTREELEAVADQLKGWVGYRRLPVILRLGDGRRESPLESRTVLTFDRWGYRLEPQFEVPGTRYRADARLEGTRVLIETDGRTKYDDPSVLVGEKVREDDLRADGWSVIRVTDELLNRPKVLFARFQTILRDASRPSVSAA